MHTYTCILPDSHLNDIKLKMLSWAQNRFSIFAFLDNNGYASADLQYECILAIAGNNHIICRHNDSFSKIRNFHESNPGWIFGHINYPSEKKKDEVFPASFFFQPQILVIFKNNSLQIESDSIFPAEVLNEIECTDISAGKLQCNHSVQWQETISKEEYIHRLTNILDHIQRGDCYEINFCMEFIGDAEIHHPVSVFQSLTKASPNPFSAFYRMEDAYVFCASPERFLQRKNETVISQPIKGTARRNHTDEEKDKQILQSLLHNPKEQTENVMIVDLVRNDLSKIAQTGTVKVRELMGLYTFPHVHHLVSTVEAKMSKELHWTDILKACFPMGSMTGAPKKRVMELTDQYEETARGLFSGTIGYVSPSGDFDFNVVIRSVFYDNKQKKISCKVGSGITIHSDPEKEYEECEVKIEAIKSLFKQ